MKTIASNLVRCAGVAAAVAPCATGAQAARPAAKPNVIIVYIDDMGYADLGCYGEKRWATPNLDRLASEGVRFTDFYSASSVSSPSRAALMTGRYPIRMGIQGVFASYAYTGMPQSEVTIAEMLKPEGYATSIVGKWHLGSRERFLPLQQGFDEYFGIPYSNDMDGTVYMRGNEVEQYEIDQTQMTKKYTHEAVDFIKRNAEKPFFLYLAHNMMHVPIYTSPEFEGKSGVGPYGDAVMEVDWSVGQVMTTLEQLGIDKNTIIIFSSDNGPWLREGPLGGTALPLREGKGTEFEGGVRVPCIASWKGHFKPQVNSSVATMMDWLPTIASLCGAKLPEARLDGYDISPVLKGKGKRASEDYAYFFQDNHVIAYRSGDWKIWLPADQIKGNFWRETTAAHGKLLFNLHEDVGETTNVWNKYPEKAAEMEAKLNAYVAGFGEVPPAMVMRNNSQRPELMQTRQDIIKEAKDRGVKSKQDVVRGFAEAK